jgi:uncharacterized protein (TIGR03790 family)
MRSHNPPIVLAITILFTFFCFRTPTGFAAVSLADFTSTLSRPSVILPKNSLGPADLAVIINDADPLSVQIAEYYQAKREIPAANMVHVRFPPGSTVMSREEFQRIKKEVDSKTPGQVQAFALTWAKPYRVDCMSITTAFAAGFDPKFCANGCQPTQQSLYFNSGSTAPFTDFGLRPAMSLAGENFEEVKKLIDRGVQSDTTHPPGTGYLVDTSDQHRNVRAADFEALQKLLGGIVKLEHIKTDALADKTDILFYFTGKTRVSRLSTNTFVPGAIADHLTSTGGQLTDSSQMSSLRWLEAGATGSYGAVVEPCNYPAKFPHPGVVIAHYTSGQTLIEAYWKSVAMPGQGIFIGEPLANPYGGSRITFSGGVLTIHTYALTPGCYTIQGADLVIGPYRQISSRVCVGLGMKELRIANARNRYYKIVPEKQEEAARP